jgi:hypothetical protein
MTTCPRARPFSTYRTAFGTSLSGYVRSMAGAIFRDAAHGGDLGPEGFGKLNGVVAHSLRSPSIDA